MRICRTYERVYVCGQAELWREGAYLGSLFQYEIWDLVYHDAFDLLAKYSATHLAGTSIAELIALEISKQQLAKGFGSWTRMEDVFSASGDASHNGRSSRNSVEDEEALRWAALEKLPTYNRLRTTIMSKNSIRTLDRVLSTRFLRLLKIRELDPHARQGFIDKVFKVAEEDNESFLRKFRDRVDKVGISLPTVEVRFENLSVEADCHMGDRALPTLINSATNIAESLLAAVGISFTEKAKLQILKDASGIIKPSSSPNYGSSTSGYFTIKMHHNGKFHVNVTRSYIGGVADFFDFCSADEMSMIEIREMARLCGIDPDNVAFTYSKSGVDDCNNLSLLETDINAMNLAYFLDGDNCIGVYVEHEELEISPSAHEVEEDHDERGSAGESEYGMNDLPEVSESVEFIGDLP
ncbi:transcription factor [Orobanche minor]